MSTRYREGAPPEQVGSAVSNEMLIGSAVYGLLLGIGLVIVGIRAKQAWLAFWGGVLVLGSAAYLVTVAAGFG